MRILFPVSVLITTLGLVACTPTVPDSAAGVGFGNYEEYERQRAAREAAIRGTATPDPSAISSETPAAQDSGVVVAGNDTSPQSTTDRTSPTRRSSGISDEQEFDAVAERETIESDRERLAANRQQYVEIAPTAVPTRSGSNRPNIVEYALKTTNNVGQGIYSRSVIFAESRFQRNCANFASSDLAQEAFLNAGGPRHDRRGLDPDGDGFACYWDPAPFRNARRQVQRSNSTAQPTEN